MFVHEAAARSDRSNLVLAGGLASVAGFVNAVGFLSFGTFTSHATGNVGRVVDDFARGHETEGSAHLMLVGAFFLGAFSASLALEARKASHPQRAYAALLLLEAVGLVVVAASGSPSYVRWSTTAVLGVLCFVMGVQNSLVTRLSGAVVRTTHLTGALTDLGIEAARWIRFAWGDLRPLRARRAEDPRPPPDRPHSAKVLLLACIVLSFTAGGLGGATLALHFRMEALLLPAAALVVGALYAFAGRTAFDGSHRR